VIKFSLFFRREVSQIPTTVRYYSISKIALKQDFIYSSVGHYQSIVSKAKHGIARYHVFYKLCFVT